MKINQLTRCILLTIFTALVPTRPSFGAEQPPQHSVSARGSASVRAPPDTLFYLFYVLGEGESFEEAEKMANANSEQLRETMRKEFQSLKEVSIAPIKIKEKNSMNYWTDSSTKTTRQVAINRVIFGSKIELMPYIPTILETAIGAGAALQLPATMVPSGEPSPVIYYGLYNSKKAEEEARTQAIANAREKASLLARDANNIMGTLISVSEEETPFSDYDYIRVGKYKLPAKYLSCSNEPLEVTSTLRVAYELMK